MNPYKSPDDTQEYNKYHDPVWWVQTCLEILFCTIVCLVLLPGALILGGLTIIGGIIWLAFAPLIPAYRYWDFYVISFVIWFIVFAYLLGYWDLNYNSGNLLRPIVTIPSQVRRAYGS